MSTSPRISSADHARRLIALLGRLEGEGEFALDRLAEELDSSPSELAADLTILSLCGVSARNPMDLVPVYLDGGVVHVWGKVPGMRGPVRLAPFEARALAAALGAAGFSADDPLTARLLDAASASFDAETLARSIRTDTPTHAPITFEVLAGAIADSQVLDILYHSDGAAAPRRRLVEPHSIFVDRGAWYLRAWCRSAGEERTFRIDRIRSIEPTGEHFAARDAADSQLPGLAFVADDLPRALLRFAPGEAFSEREWPGGRVAAEAPDGSLTAEVPFSGTGWIARQVAARVGRVEALEPESVRSAVAAFARGELERLGG